MRNLEKIQVVELSNDDLSKIEGGTWGPFNFGIRVFMKPAFIVWEAQQMV